MKHRSLFRWTALALGLLVVGVAPLPQSSAQLRVGSKKFTESIILGEMLRLLAEEDGIKTVHYREFGGTRIVFDALVIGDIDIYPEYTGTITHEIFADEKIPDDAALQKMLAERGIGMSGPLGFNNSYALALTRRRAAELGISRISDLQRLPELRIALTHEFLDRGDGWPALKRHYDLPQQDVVGVDHDIAYRQLLSGEIDVMDVYSTDAMIHRGDLVLLEDDRSFFPRYEAVWLYRIDVASRYPAMLRAIGQLDGTLSESEMQSLNDEVEAGRLNETQAAARFLGRKVTPDPDARAPSRSRMIAGYVAEHLDLVRRSLLPAIVVGVALGIFCQRRPRRSSGADIGRTFADNPFAGPARAVIAAGCGARLSKHRRRLDHGSRGAFLLLPAADCAKYLYRTRWHPARHD